VRLTALRGALGVSALGWLAAAAFWTVGATGWLHAVALAAGLGALQFQRLPAEERRWVLGRLRIAAPEGRP
jgi:hypothetical protein